MSQGPTDGSEEAKSQLSSSAAQLGHSSSCSSVKRAECFLLVKVPKLDESQQFPPGPLLTILSVLADVWELGFLSAHLNYVTRMKEALTAQKCACF